MSEKFKQGRQIYPATLIALRLASQDLSAATREKDKRFEQARTRMQERDCTVSEACAYTGTDAAVDAVRAARDQLLDALDAALRDIGAVDRDSIITVTQEPLP
mgnify:CR=1 FL=1